IAMIVSPTPTMTSQVRRRRCVRVAASAGAVSTVASMLASGAGRGGGKAPAECAYQVYAEGKTARLQLRAQSLREQHLVLAREHRQVVVESGAVAIARQVIGTLRGVECDLL